MDQGVTVLIGDAGKLANVVAGVAQRGQQPDGGGRGVQADGVADAGMLGRVGRQHQHDPPLRGWYVAQLRVLDGDAGDPRGAFGVWHVGGEPVWPHFLERERDGDQSSVEFGDGDLGCGVHWGQAVVAGVPLFARTGQAQPLQDWDVELGQGADVPFLVAAAGPDRRR